MVDVGCWMAWVSMSIVYLVCAALAQHFTCTRATLLSGSSIPYHMGDRALVLVVIRGPN